jgi:hypothetical protein
MSPKAFYFILGVVVAVAYYHFIAKVPIQSAKPGAN